MSEIWPKMSVVRPLAEWSFFGHIGHIGQLWTLCGHSDMSAADARSHKSPAIDCYRAAPTKRRASTCGEIPALQNGNGRLQWQEASG